MANERRARRRLCSCREDHAYAAVIPHRGRAAHDIARIASPPLPREENTRTASLRGKGAVVEQDDRSSPASASVFARRKRELDRRRVGMRVPGLEGGIGRGS